MQTINNIKQWWAGVDKLRLKYNIKARLRMFFGFIWYHRNYPTNEAWDKELWDLLATGQISFVDTHEAIIGDHIVWISNYPYASGQLTDNRNIRPRPACSLATALFLNDQLPHGRLVTNLCYTPEERKWVILAKRYPEQFPIT